jgi:hypothetical protein
MSSDIELDLTTGDRVLRNGDQAYVSGSDALLQRLTLQLQTDRGEYDYDLGEGTPYTQSILGSRDPDEVTARITAVLLDDPEITSAESVTASLDPITRRLTVQATLNSVYGSVDLRAVV